MPNPLVGKWKLKVKSTKERHLKSIYPRLMENKPINLLLIDDDEVTNMINTKLIAKHFQYQVTAYTNGQECLADLKRWHSEAPENLPNAIFLDINMPQMDGWEFLDQFEKLPVDV